jgi:hypothetical protein
MSVSDHFCCSLSSSHSSSVDWFSTETLDTTSLDPELDLGQIPNPRSMVSEAFLSTGIAEDEVEVEVEEWPELAGGEEDPADKSDLSVVSAVAVQYLALCNAHKALSGVTRVNRHTLSGTMDLLAAVPSDTSTHRCIPLNSDP